MISFEQFEQNKYNSKMQPQGKKRKSIKQSSFLSDNPVDVYGSSVAFKFPKEFKKKWLEQLDLRFLIILLVTFVVEIGLIIFLTARIKGLDQPVNVKKIQKRYANLLLTERPRQEISKIDEAETKEPFVSQTTALHVGTDKLIEEKPTPAPPEKSEKKV
ncbi:MAG: hypothetical protein SCK70_12030, partial [bacterium]|nr:hypothetical protein [bacterium]